ncbi:hypothetical protein KQ939_12640 [Planococcus sp. CP5-4]|uniref:hypothetical protein n=1 Tax=Planococcus TaxID=1372 RepID=UPI001B8CBB70|nr:MULTISPECIES: hypothetical protein [unclassified Planococcus (in: firmicutes)]MBU9674165.1 hypothetical protein [Planococcus sp. CP5-4_YE]MBV0910016.1 hypothetical protein [Planococcus sp. CP5-4_UN]MBW6064550.1 hypothetical protein [Planococcus sp. CP5-4]
MPLISRAEIAVFEKRVQLPMVLLILERDRECIQKGPFKLKAPYLELLDRAIERAKGDLAETIAFMRANGMKVRRGSKDDNFSEYVFCHGGYEDHRRYLNIRLKNAVEDQLRLYLTAAAKSF